MPIRRRLSRTEELRKATMTLQELLNRGTLAGGQECTRWAGGNGPDLNGGGWCEAMSQWVLSKFYRGFSYE